MDINNDIWWFAYLHSNQTVQLKRWFGDVKDYREDCENNPFVVKVVTPFIASSRDDAMKIAMMELTK